MNVWIKALLPLCLAVTPALSQAPPSEAPPAESSPANTEATHNELRALRDGLLDAVNRDDIEEQLTYVDPNVVVTAINGDVVRGREGVRAYRDKMLSGPGRVVESFHCDVTVDELTILYGGDTGVAFGTALQKFKMTSGLQLDATSRWTATLVKENGQWLLASFHSSANLFDNPVLTMAKRTAYWAGGGALLAGLVAGVFFGRMRKRVG